MSRGCDRIGALSFREGDPEGKLQVIPPLIRDEFRNLSRHPGTRHLVYLLQPGFLEDFVGMAKEDPDFQADIFLDTLPERDMPPNISLFLPDDLLFKEKMQACKSLITTSGFDTIAEAALLSVPVLALPVKNHYEQRCNAVDMQLAGFGLRVDAFKLETVNNPVPYINKAYFDWINQSEKMLLDLIEK